MSVRICRPRPTIRLLHDLSKTAPKISTQTRHRNYSDSSTPASSVHASRVLPYPALSIFNIISDISSYPQFLPYVRASKVLSESARADSYHEKHWPASASLTVGFRENISETFTSRVYCVPPTPKRGRAGVGFVEAISGSEAPPPSFTADADVGHYDIEAQKSEQEADTQEGPLAYLRTRWTVGGYPHKPAPAGGQDMHAADIEGKDATEMKEMTNVSLLVEYRFKNPVYELMSKAATPKVADAMIEAFEKRCKETLPGHEQAR